MIQRVARASSTSGAPFSHMPHDVTIVMERGHELVGRLERDLGDARTLLRERFSVDAAFRGQCKQSALGGVADEFAIADA